MSSAGIRTHRHRTQNREDMRMLLAEAERALTELQYSENQSFASGMLLYALNTLYQSVQRHRQYFQGRSVGRPQSSALIKLAMRPNNNPTGVANANRSAPDKRGV